MEDVFEVQMDTVVFVRSPRMVFFFYLQRAEAVFFNKIDILYYIFQCLIQRDGSIIRRVGISQDLINGEVSINAEVRKIPRTFKQRFLSEGND